MEWLSGFGMREWLITCGLVLVVVVLIDGFRRMRSERKNEIKMSRKMGGGFPELTGADGFTAELPNGGARVIERAEPHLSSEHLKADQRGDAVRQFHDSLDELESENASGAHRASEQEFNLDQQILVLHVKSRLTGGFNGSDLLQVLLACDMRYGDRDILHRHERAGGTGSLQFSVANMLEPGTFDLEDINTFKTPGVSFFMTLPGPLEPGQAFDCMVETANCVVKNLDADLLDEDHQLMTEEALQALRDRVNVACLS